jgi:N-acetylneuraminate synthase/sialic acid synthase
MTETLLDGIPVGHDYPPYIIAELGHNHLGDMNECKMLMSMARDAGVQAVKLQKRENETLYTNAFYNSAYNSENAYATTYGRHRDHLEFTFGQYLELQEFAAGLGISFIATAFDLPSVDFLEALDVPYYKIASGSISNPLLLRRLARLGTPLVASFGGATNEEVARAVETLSEDGAPLVLLHCVAAYPARPPWFGLRRIDWLAETFPSYVVGFSDHDDGISLGAVAYAHGARVFEKHITRDHTNKGTDHAFSLEFGGLVSYIKNIDEAAIADTILEHPVEVELSPVTKMRSSCYLNKDMAVGQVVQAEDIVIKSPEDGIPGWGYDELIGRGLIVDVNKEQPLKWEYFDI